MPRGWYSCRLRIQGGSECVTCTPGSGSVAARARRASGLDGVEVGTVVGVEAAAERFRRGRRDELLELLRVRLQLGFGGAREALGQGGGQLVLGCHVVEQDLPLQRLDLPLQ